MPPGAFTLDGPPPWLLAGAHNTPSPSAIAPCVLTPAVIEFLSMNTHNGTRARACLLVLDVPRARQTVVVCVGLPAGAPYVSQTSQTPSRRCRKSDTYTPALADFASLLCTPAHCNPRQEIHAQGHPPYNGSVGVATRGTQVCSR